jgi:uncharacterized membrane protein YfcA
LSGLLGVGGGIVVVPVLYLLSGQLALDPGVRMHVAVGTSLASIVLTSIVAARAHRQRGTVDSAVLRGWAPWLFAGAILGAAIGGAVPGEILSAIFAAVALGIALHMAFAPATFRLRQTLPVGRMRAVFGTVIGAFSAMMGIGGGTLSVPFFTACGYPVHRAVGTASALGLVIAIPASIGFVATGWNVAALPQLSVGFINLLGLVLIAPLSLVSAPLGVALALRLPGPILKRVFAAFLFVTSVRMLAGFL